MASVYSAGEARYGTVPVRGDLQLALQYNYQQGALEVSVKQCRDLAAVDAKRNRSDPYVPVRTSLRQPPLLREWAITGRSELCSAKLRLIG